MAHQQIEAVTHVLSELDVGHIPFISVWNKVQNVGTFGCIGQCLSTAGIPCSVLLKISNRYFAQIDRAQDSDLLRAEAIRRGNTVCVSALSGEGMDDFFEMIENKIKVAFLIHMVVRKFYCHAK